MFLKNNPIIVFPPWSICMWACASVCMYENVFSFKRFPKDLSICVSVSWHTQFSIRLLGSHAGPITYGICNCREDVGQYKISESYQIGMESIGEQVLSENFFWYLVWVFTYFTS